MQTRKYIWILINSENNSHHAQVTFEVWKQKSFSIMLQFSFLQINRCHSDVTMITLTIEDGRVRSFHQLAVRADATFRCVSLSLLHTRVITIKNSYRTEGNTKTRHAQNKPSTRSFDLNLANFRLNNTIATSITKYETPHVVFMILYIWQNALECCDIWEDEWLLANRKFIEQEISRCVWLRDLWLRWQRKGVYGCYEKWLFWRDRRYLSSVSFVIHLSMPLTAVICFFFWKRYKYARVLTIRQNTALWS